MWIGTESGLNKFDKKNKITSYTCKKTGFENDFIYGIIEENDSILWLSTNKGLVRFNKKLEKITTFGKKDGLLNYEFNIGAYFKNDKGKMFFGGVNGINYFFPDSIKINNISPKVVITKVILNNQKGTKEIFFDSLSTIELIYKDNFTLFFALPEFSKSKINYYKYKLNENSDNWSHATTQHYVNFSSLSPGKYTFEIIGANSDKRWNKTPTKIYIIINPPFWRTNIAYTIYVLLFIILFALIVIYFTKSIRKDNRMLLDKNLALQEVERQSEEIEIKNKNITDSINYASKIIEALLPPRKNLEKMFSDSFILYLPKDIVSGDFYWFIEKNNFLYIAAVDCTGHGIPGAFMSIVGLDLFRNYIKINETDPARILNKMNLEIRNILQKQSEDIKIKDGMDLALCIINKQKNNLKFSGAFNPLYLIRDGSLTQLKADRFTIGQANTDKNDIFSTQNFNIQKNDVIYLFTDGYTDQFGGNDNKKFKFRRFRHLLLSIYNKKLSEQKRLLELAHIEWKRNYEQVDDILIIGLKPYQKKLKYPI